MAVFGDWCRLSETLGIPLHECLSVTPHSHLRIWREYWRHQRDNPSVDQAYLMQIALEVRSVLSKKRYKLTDFQLKFDKPKKPTRGSVEQETSKMKAALGAVFGMFRKKD